MKKKIESTITICVGLLESMMIKYMKHESTCIHQFRQIDALKKNLHPKEVIIHCDFSENYSSQCGKEAQAVHFGGSRKQYTLHTAVVYYRKDVYSMVQLNSICSLSECNDHTAPAVWAHLQPVFKFVNKVCPQIRRVNFLTDSPSAQYRNRIIFYLLSRKKRAHHAAHLNYNDLLYFTYIILCLLYNRSIFLRFSHNCG